MTGRANLVIEAAAGTGKTTAIVREVLELLCRKPDISPERIVLMTFTEKAAGEIAERIRGALTDLATTLDHETPHWPSGTLEGAIFVAGPELRDGAATACRRILPRIDLLRSQTIHSFCQTLIRHYPIEAGLPPQFKVVEGFERSRVMHEIFESWLETELSPSTSAANLAEWRLLMKHLGGIDEIESTLLSLLPRADMLGDPSLGLGSAKHALPCVAEAFDVLRSFDPAGTKASSEQIRVVEFAKATPFPPSPSIEALISWLEPLEVLLPGVPLNRGPRKGGFVAALRLLRGSETDASQSLRRTLLAHRAAEALRDVALRYSEFVATEREARGMVDFDDMLVRARALFNDPRVLADIRARFDYVFVDEFQDTDRIQSAIVDSLARDRNGALVPGRTTLVGDPKQSIYAFRRADPETYRDTIDSFVSSGAESRQLAKQYRSDELLVSAINDIFLALFPETPSPDPNAYRPDYVRVAPTRGRLTEGDEPRITLLLASSGPPSEAASSSTPSADADGKKRTGKSDRRREEASAVAGWIEQHRDRAPNGLKSFAILVRKRNAIPGLADALERRGIDVVVPASGNLLEQPAVVDLLAVLTAVAHPFDRSARISAARSSCFALTDDEILEHRIGCVRESCPFDAFEARLRSWEELASRATVTAVVETVLAETDVEAIHAASRGHERSLRQIERLLEIAARFDRDRGGSLSQFVDELTARREEEAESEPNLSDDGANAVRIMTVHAAKGLEFDYVILPDLDHRMSGNTKVSVFTTSAPRALVMTGPVRSISSWAQTTPSGEALDKVSAIRGQNEEDRIFYVAMTRARLGLAAVFHPSSETQGFVRQFLRITGCSKAAELIALWPPDPGPGELRLTTDARVPVMFGRSSPTGETRERSRLEHERAIAIAEMHPEPSAIRAELRAALEPKESPSGALSASEAARQLAGASNREAGILLHRVLEVWNGSQPALDDLIDSLSVETATNHRERNAVRRRLARLAQSLTWRRLQEGETIGREVSIHIADPSGGAVEKRIDRIVREADGLLVVDYKSGAADAERSAEDREQVRRYCDAISAVTGESCHGLIWYLGVDREETVEVSSS